MWEGGCEGVRMCVSVWKSSVCGCVKCVKASSIKVMTCPPPPPFFLPSQSPTPTSQCPTSPFVRTFLTSVPSFSPAIESTAPTSLPPASSSFPRASNSSPCTPTACSSLTHSSHVSCTCTCTLASQVGSPWYKFCVISTMIH